MKKLTAFSIAPVNYHLLFDLSIEIDGSITPYEVRNQIKLTNPHKSPGHDVIVGEIIMIAKSGKPSTEAKSYGPINLLSTLLENFWTIGTKQNKRGHRTW